MKIADPRPRSRLLWTLMGATLGFLLHMLGLGLVIGIGQVISLVDGTSKTAEGSFWALFLIFLASPAGIVTGAVTGLLGSSTKRSWLQVTLCGAIPAALGGVLVSLSFLTVYDDANIAVGVFVAMGGLLIAAVVAGIGRVGRRR